MAKLKFSNTDCKLEMMRNSELFAATSKRRLRALAKFLTIVEVEPGYLFAAEGHRPGDFVVVVEGEVLAAKDAVPVAVLCAGTHFGELGLLHRELERGTDHAPLTTTAMTPVTALVAGSLEFASIFAADRGFAQTVLSRGRSRLAALRECAAALRDTTQEQQLVLTDVW